MISTPDPDHWRAPNTVRNPHTPTHQTQFSEARGRIQRLREREIQKGKERHSEGKRDPAKHKVGARVGNAVVGVREIWETEHFVATLAGFRRCQGWPSSSFFFVLTPTHHCFSRIWIRSVISDLGEFRRWLVPWILAEASARKVCLAEARVRRRLERTEMSRGLGVFMFILFLLYFFLFLMSCRLIIGCCKMRVYSSSFFKLFS
jgi:hypothetical protein